MSEKEKNIIKEIALTVPKLSKEKQNYILGVAEGMVIAKEDRDKEITNKTDTVQERRNQDETNNECTTDIRNLRLWLDTGIQNHKAVK